MIKISKEQMLEYADQIKAIYRWEEAVEFCRKIYGEKAVKLYVTYESIYDDEGGYHPGLESFSVYDILNNELKPDSNTDWAKSILEKNSKNDLEDWARDDAYGYLACCDGNIDDFECELLKPPYELPDIYIKG